MLSRARREAARLRPRQRAPGPGGERLAYSPSGVVISARRATWRPSNSRSTRSTGAAICSRSAWCCTDGRGPVRRSAADRSSRSRPRDSEGRAARPGGWTGASWALDRVIQRALRGSSLTPAIKRPPAFAQDLRGAMLITDSDRGAVGSGDDAARGAAVSRAAARPGDRLPGISLADAISSALSGLPSLVVRSTAAAAAFANGTPDFAALARGAGRRRRAARHPAEQRRSRCASARSSCKCRPGRCFRPITSQVDEWARSSSCRTTWRSSIVRFVVALAHGPAIRDASTATCRPARKRPGGICAPTSWSSTRCTGRPRSTCTGAAWSAIRNSLPAWARLGRCYRVMGKFGDRAVCARRSGHSARASPEACARHQPGPVAGPQSLCAGSRSRPAAPARRWFGCSTA